MEPNVSALGPHQRHGDHHAKGRRCGARTRLLAVLALAAVAGCTTIALQLLASNLNSWPGGHKGEAMRAEFLTASSSATGVAPLPPTARNSWEPGEGKQPAGGTERRRYGDTDLSLAVPGHQQGRRLPLVVDRRFTGQRTGRPPKPEEEASLLLVSVEMTLSTTPPPPLRTLHTEHQPCAYAPLPPHKKIKSVSHLWEVVGGVTVALSVRRGIYNLYRCWLALHSLSLPRRSVEACSRNEYTCSRIHIQLEQHFFLHEKTAAVKRYTLSLRESSLYQVHVQRP